MRYVSGSNLGMSMKIQTTIEISPKEAKELFGIPDNAYMMLLRSGNLTPPADVGIEAWQEYQKLFNPLNWISQKSSSND